MKILVTGSRGYIGIPLCYELSESHTVIGVDNLSRAEWVNYCGGKESTVLLPDDVHTTINADISNLDTVMELLAIHKPDCIIHLASQPSMPYSQINGERALYTQQNNTAMCLNLLWGLKQSGLKSRLIVTTTTGIPGQHYQRIPETHTMNFAGSWYHVSRGFDSANCNLASRQWGQEVLELRTSIVYGVQTDYTKKHTSLLTRFDTDPYFGTALNRFVQQGIDKEPITIYGKGKQTKPFISLNDCVKSIIHGIKFPLKEPHTVLNQVTEHISIERLAKIAAKATGTKVSYVPNPRKENETFSMHFDNHDFLKLLYSQPTKMKDEIPKMIAALGYPYHGVAFTTGSNA